MGITTSKKYIAFEDYKKPFKNKDNELIKKINKIASKMILETSSKEILKFLEPNYCNSIIQILTNILKKNYTENKIKAIHSLIKNHKSLETNILDLNKIEIGKEKITRPKKIFCEEVAIYYVKFSHLYSAIYHVINPILNDKEVSLENLTFCKKRDMENNVEELINKDKSNINVIVSNHFCDINKKTKISNNKESHTYLKKLGEESGIKELDDLYKDKYDPIKKNFFMSKESKKEYSTVLTKIYKTFTGEELPDDIKHFKDVPLYRYEKKKMCTTKELDFKTGYVGTIADNDILKYIEHIKEIMDITYKNNEKFIKILDEMFKKDEATNEIIINDEFTMDELDKKTKEVRKFIVSMYIDCEKNFRKGIKLFKKIVLNSKLKKIIKMEKANVDNNDDDEDYDNDDDEDDDNDEEKDNNIQKQKDEHNSSVKLLESFEEFSDRIIKKAPLQLHTFGYIILHDLYNYLKESQSKKSYKGYCLQMIAELIYCLLFCDIKILSDKTNIYYSLFINICSSQYEIIGKNIIEIPQDKKNLMKIDEFNGIHFRKCCDFDCALSRKCEKDIRCKTYECFIKGERWSYSKKDGETIDLCGKCYNNFENLKEKKEFTKDTFKKQTVRNSFNDDICVKIENTIRFPEDLKSDGYEFRQLWYNNFYNRTWNNIDNDNITFRVIKDISLNNKVINQYEGISILYMKSFESTNQYNIDKIENVKKSVHITFGIRPNEKVTGILNKNIIIFPRILEAEKKFLNQFITEDITDYTRSGTTSLSQSNTDNSIFKGIIDFLNLPKESKMNEGIDIKDADTDTHSI